MPRERGGTRRVGTLADSLAPSFVLVYLFASQLKLLRQLVDWQLAHSESIRAKIQEHYKMGHQKQTDFNPLTNELVVQPIGQDRNKKRYWTFDGEVEVPLATVLTYGRGVL